MARKKTHEEYVAQVADINSNIEVIGKYVDAKTNILHKCKIDGHEWSPSPDSILRGRGCPECGKRIVSKKLSMSHEEYVSRVNQINPNIEVVSEYINSATKVKFHCLFDDYVWDAYPFSILKGTGCPRCSGKERYTTQTFIEKVHRINPDITIIGEYKNKNTQVDCMCKEGHVYRMLPGNIYKGYGCPECSGNMKKTQEKYVEEVEKINKDIEVTGFYISACTPIYHICKKCKNSWLARPHHILEGHGCPFCNASVGERMVANYLDERSVIYIPQYTFDNCRNIRRLPFDFYLPEFGALIEYDGIQHYFPVERFGGKEAFLKTQENDSIKTNYCFDNNIPLIRIRYNEDICEKLDEFFKSL